MDQRGDRTRHNSDRKAVRRERAAGYRDGWETGYRLGLCDAVPRRESVAAGKRNIGVLFVQSGFAALDHGIAAALQRIAGRSESVPDSESMSDAAERIRADIVLVLNGTRVRPENVQRMRGMNIRTVLWLVDDPYHTREAVRYAGCYDDVFTHELGCVPVYRALGCSSVRYMPLAADPGLYYPERVEREYRTDICFIGNAFANRLQFVDRIADYLADKRVFIAGWWWDRLRRARRLAGKLHHNRTWLPPEITARYYNGAKIVVNMHRASEDGQTEVADRPLQALSVNPRTFEINACGAFQLTDARSDLPRHYEPGRELAVYTSPGHFCELADYYLRHDRERSEIAARGYARTLLRHTFEIRVGELLEQLLADARR